MKKFIMALMCMLCSLCIYTGTTEAASAKSSYTVKKGTTVNGAIVTVKGQTKKTITLNVKESGKLKLILTSKYDGVSPVKGKEQIKVQILNSKGKALSTKTVTAKNKTSYSSLELKKGTYRVVISTKNMKKTTSRKQMLGFVFHNGVTVKADNKTVYEMLDSKGKAKIKFVNDKAQAIAIDASFWDREHMSFTVKDTKGNVVFTDMRDHNNNGSWHYLPKGTYYIETTDSCGAAYRIASYKIKVSKAYSQPTVTATSKEKAILYNGKELILTNLKYSSKKELQWIKVDTAKKDYLFNILSEVSPFGYDGDDSEISGVNVYKEDGTEVGYDEWKGVRLNKGTGIYYISIPTKATLIARVVPNKMYSGSVQTNKGKAFLLKYDQVNLKAVSSENKEVTGTVALVEDCYVRARVNNKKLITIYNSSNQKVTADADGYAKLKKGTYSFKASVEKANTEYSCSFLLYKASNIEKDYTKFTTKTKKIKLSGTKVGVMNSFYATLPLSEDKGKNVKIKLYENGVKIKEGNNGVWFAPKSKKVYTAEVTLPSANHFVKHGVTVTGYDYTMANGDLKNTKKAAKTYKLSNTSFKAKGYNLNGKFSKWIKVTGDKKSGSTIGLESFMNKGQMNIKVYSSDGRLVKSYRSTATSDFNEYCVKIPKNKTYYFNFSSTDKNTLSDLILRKY